MTAKRSHDGPGRPLAVRTIYERVPGPDRVDTIDACMSNRPGTALDTNPQGHGFVPRALTCISASPQGYHPRWLPK